MSSRFLGAGCSTNPAKLLKGKHETNVGGVAQWLLSHLPEGVLQRTNDWRTDLLPVYSVTGLVAFGQWRLPW